MSRKVASGPAALILLASEAMCLHTAALAQAGSYTVFRSEDRGRNWVQAGAGLRSDARINAFAATGNVVLAGTDGGIYVSRDRGLNWKAATAALRILSFATLGKSVYAGTDSGGLIVSPDGGVNWAVNTGLPFRKVRALLAHEGALYAGTDAQGVFVSRDGGKFWTPMSQGLPAGAQIFSMASLKGKIFAALYSKGLYVWANQGPSWRKAGPVSPLVLAATGETLLAGHNPGGIFRSDDSGATWQAGEIAVSQVLGKAPVWEIGAAAELAVAGISSGIYYSDDRGRTWAAVRAGIPHGSSGISFLVGKNVVLAGVFVPQDRPTRTDR